MLKVPITTAADDIFSSFFLLFFNFSQKTNLDILYKQTIYMKCQDLFSQKNE